MRKLQKVFLAMAFGGMIIFAGCNNQNGSESGTATLKVKLIDAPAAFDKVNIDVVDVQINYGDQDSGFVSLDGVQTGVYDLLELTGGVEAVLADAEIPAGYINQIRLILGENNTVVVDGIENNLTVPSGSESGLKIKIGADLTDGEVYQLTLDFDVAKSVHKAGNSGKYQLKPVIRAIVEDANVGGIKGSVDPAVKSKVLAIMNSDTVSTHTNNDGNFVLAGLEVGTYSVSIVPNQDSLYASQLIENVVVVADSIVNLGIISLN